MELNADKEKKLSRLHKNKEDKLYGKDFYTTINMPLDNHILHITCGTTDTKKTLLSHSYDCRKWTETWDLSQHPKKSSSSEWQNFLFLNL